MRRANFISLTFSLLLAVTSCCREETLHSMYVRVGCSLPEVPADIPETSKSVQLDNNDITRIQAFQFAELDEVTRLLLNRNKISKIEEKAFKGLDSLKQLNLANNKLTFLYGKLMWIGMKYLEELDLSYNLINDIEPYSFKYLNNLKVLKLRGNNLTELYEDMWEGMTELTELVLSDNKIATVWYGGFANLPLLRKLTLNDNALITLESNAFSPISTPGIGHPSHMQLTIDNNPLECDARLCWLKEAEQDGWVTFHGLYYDPPECAGVNIDWQYLDLNCTSYTIVDNNV